MKSLSNIIRLLGGYSGSYRAIFISCLQKGVLMSYKEALLAFSEELKKNKKRRRVVFLLSTGREDT